MANKAGRCTFSRNKQSAYRINESYNFYKAIFSKINCVATTLATTRYAYPRWRCLANGNILTLLTIAPPLLHWPLLYVDRLESMCAEGKDRAKLVIDGMIQQTFMELETGGNVRFEYGKPSDPW